MKEIVRWAIVGDDSLQQPEGLLVGRCLVDLEKEVVPVRVLNPSPHVYQVARGTSITSCKPVISVHACQTTTMPSDDILSLQPAENDVEPANTDKVATPC